MTGIYLVEDSTQLVWNVCRTFKMTILEEINVVLNENSVEVKPWINRESKSLELII